MGILLNIGLTNGIFRCASISWFEVVSRWVIDIFTASASTGLSDYLYLPHTRSIGGCEIQVLSVGLSGSKFWLDMMDGLGQIGQTFLHCFTLTINQTRVYTFLVIVSIFTNLFGHVTENNSNGRQTVNAVFRQSCQIKNIQQAAIRILASNL